MLPFKKTATSPKLSDAALSLIHRLLCETYISMESLKKYPRRESNSHLRFRKPLFYPLNYGGDGKLMAHSRTKVKMCRRVSTRNR